MDFLKQVWLGQNLTQTAWETLASEVEAQGELLVSSAPDADDLFSGYCVASWLPQFAPDVFERFGHRSITESFELASEVTASQVDTLDHLACRYYRFYVQPTARELHVRVDPVSRSHDLKAILCEALKDADAPYSCGRRITLSRGDDAGLVGSLTDLNADALDHLVLAVVNCGTRPMPEGYMPPLDEGDPEHDDGQGFRIAATAE